MKKFAFRNGFLEQEKAPDAQEELIRSLVLAATSRPSGNPEKRAEHAKPDRQQILAALRADTDGDPTPNETAATPASCPEQTNGNGGSDYFAPPPCYSLPL